MIYLRPCEPMDVSTGDLAEVFVDVDGSGTFDSDERYQAVVSGTDVNGAATEIAMKVYVECDLIDNDPHVAIYAVGGLGLVDSDENPIDYLQVDTFNPRAVSGGTDDAQPMASAIILHPNYPNPFNPSTEIHFTLSTVSDVRLNVYDILGRRVATLIDENLEGGEHIIQWDGKGSDGQSLASGIYFYRLTAGEFVETKKMMLVK